MAQQSGGRRLAELLQRASSMLALGITQQSGRGLVARRPISQGTIVLEETPLVCAPAPQHRGKVTLLARHDAPSMLERRQGRAPPRVVICPHRHACAHAGNAGW